MIPYLARLWKSFWMDEMVASRIFRGFLLWAGGMAVSILAFPFDDVVTWTTREWLYRVAAAAALGFAGLVSAGQKNPPADEIRAIANTPMGSPPPTP